VVWLGINDGEFRTYLLKKCWRIALKLKLDLFNVKHYNSDIKINPIKKMTPYLAESRPHDGSFQRWNLTHYQDYRKAKGNPVQPSKLEIHPLLNGMYRYKHDTVRIVQVIKQWHAGWYYMAVYEIGNINGSHGTVVIENINCIDSTILEDLKRFSREFLLI
jgi:hypothetical protein